MPEVIFNGPVGRIEGRYQQAKEDNAPMALVELVDRPEPTAAADDKAAE